MIQRRRNPERGNALVLATIVLTALATISGLTVVSVQGGMSTTTHERFHALATYAAESGGAATFEFLRANLNPTTGWTALVSADNGTIQSPTGILGNGVPVGATGNPFSVDVHSSYSVQILNNRSDSGFAAGTDADMRVIVRSTGLGPNGAIAIVEWEVAGVASTTQRPCTGYAQENMSEDNSGLNECLTIVNSGDTAKFSQ